jgi:transposase
MYLKQVHQKNTDGTRRTYLQFVESVRTEQGPRQNILINLGRIDTKSGKEKIELLAQAIVKIAETIDVLDIEKDVEGEWARKMGPELVFRKLFQKINLDNILTRTLGEKVGAEFDAKDCLFNLILNRLTDPGSKHKMTDWQKDQYGVNQYDLQHYYRTMDYLHDHQEEIEKELFDHMRKLSSTRQKDVNVALFDTTTIVYYGEGDDEENSILDYGFSKDRRSDLKQVVVGVALTADGIPVTHDAYAGNTNDVSCFERLVTKFHDYHDAKNVTFVTDRGMISNKNLALLESKNYSYVMGFRMRTIKVEERSALLRKANLKEIKENLKYKNVAYNGRRLVVYYNPERAELEAQKRDEIIERIKDRIKTGKLESIIESKDYKRFLKIEGKAPILDQEKVDADAMYDGIFVITTNTERSAAEIIETYRSLWQCEFSFRTLKSELQMGPIYHFKERRIVSHIFICFLALICRVMLTKKIKKIDKAASFGSVMADVRRLYAMKIKIKSSEVVVRTELTEGIKIAIKAPQMSYPKKVLSYQNPKLVVLQ